MSDPSIEETLRRNAEVVAQADRTVARLRESSAQATEVAERARAALHRIVAERDAYKAALQRIRDHGQTHEEPCWALHNGDCADVMQEIARSVLAGESSTTEE